MAARSSRPEPTAEKHEVYRRYLEARHDGQMSGSWEEFEEFLHEAPAFTREVVFRVGDRLLGAGIYDAAPGAVSAVYFYFDPDLAARSPGTLNVLWLVDECRRLGVPWLYLGYHVAGSPSMAYKAGFSPARDPRRRRPLALEWRHDAARRARPAPRPARAPSTSWAAPSSRSRTWPSAGATTSSSARTTGGWWEWPASRSTARTACCAAWPWTRTTAARASPPRSSRPRCERAKRVELRSVYLLTTTARDYFARRGFADCPREEAPAAIRESWEFRTGCPSTAAFMKRPVA